MCLYVCICMYVCICIYPYRHADSPGTGGSRNMTSPTARMMPVTSISVISAQKGSMSHERKSTVNLETTTCSTTNATPQ